jgi:hypothetical protein
VRVHLNRPWLLIALPLLAAGCGAAKSETITVTRPLKAAAPTRPPVRVGPQLATLAAVAQRIYNEESRGTVDQAPVRALERDRMLVHAVALGDTATARSEASRLMAAASHITGIRIVRGGHVVASVSLPFVVAAMPRPLRGVQGATAQVSIQDVLGYVSLVHRVTGSEVVVRGSSGHALASLAAATHARLPRSGRVSVAGRAYQATSFVEPGWAGERLTVWLLQQL